MYSDHIVYVDESGDHELFHISENYPVFVLAFCIFRKDAYIREVVPRFQALKFKWFGHDSVVLHEREIRKQQVPFKFLQNVERRRQFMEDLTQAIQDSPFTVIASVINKRTLRQRYAHPTNPYEIGLQFCVERLHRYLTGLGQGQATTHCVLEKRGKAEDASIELEFRRICDGANYRRANINCLEIQFADKSANSTGLQIADLVARPIGLAEIRPHQQNRAYELIQQKIRRGPNRAARGYGLKIFP